MIVYLDTSAVAKLIFAEEDSASLLTYLDACQADGAAVLSSTLLETELRRAATRKDFSQHEVSAVLSRFDLLDLERSVFTQAGVLPGRTLRSLGALHVAAALTSGADLMVSYDARQLEAAEQAGLRTVSPGQ